MGVFYVFRVFGESIYRIIGRVWSFMREVIDCSDFEVICRLIGYIWGFEDNIYE